MNHYSFHIMDPQWGHVTIKMSGHPPFGAQVILNGHEYVACQARAAGIGFIKEGNCFTAVADPARPGSGRRHLVAARDYRAPEPGLRPVDLHRLPVFRAGPATSRSAAGSATPTRSTRSSTAGTCCSPTVRGCSGCSTPWSTAPGPGWTCPGCGPCSGAKQRPHRDRRRRSAPARSHDRDTSVRPDQVQGPLRAVDVEGVHQRRTRAAVRGDRAQHQGAELRPRCSTSSPRSSPDWPAWPTGSAPPWTASISASCPTTPWIELPTPSQIGATRVGGIDLNRPRIRTALAAVLALAPHPAGSPSPDSPTKVRAMTGQTTATTPPARPPTTCASSAANTWSTNPAGPAATTSHPSRPHHRRPARPARSGHRAHPRRRPQPPTRPQTRHLDPRRPRLRNPPHRHANPVPRPRHQPPAAPRIDNILSIAFGQAPS